MAVVRNWSHATSRLLDGSWAKRRSARRTVSITTKKLGVWTLKCKPGVFFCGNCTPKGNLSPLKEEPNGWQCGVNECGKFHENPDNPLPPIMPQISDEDGYLEGWVTLAAPVECT